MSFNWPSICQTLGSIHNEPGMTVHACNLTLRRQSQKEFEGSLGYLKPFLRTNKTTDGKVQTWEDSTGDSLETEGAGAPKLRMARGMQHNRAEREPLCNRTGHGSDGVGVGGVRAYVRA